MNKYILATFNERSAKWERTDELFHSNSSHAAAQLRRSNALHYSHNVCRVVAEAEFNELVPLHRLQAPI